MDKPVTPAKIDRAKSNCAYNVIGGIVNVHTLIKLDRSIRVNRPAIISFISTHAR